MGTALGCFVQNLAFAACPKGPGLVVDSERRVNPPRIDAKAGFRLPGTCAVLKEEPRGSSDG